MPNNQLTEKDLQKKFEVLAECIVSFKDKHSENKDFINFLGNNIAYLIELKDYHFGKSFQIEQLKVGLKQRQETQLAGLKKALSYNETKKEDKKEEVESKKG